MAVGIQVKAMSARDELHGSLLSATTSRMTIRIPISKAQKKKNILRNALGASQSPFGKNRGNSNGASCRLATVSEMEAEELEIEGDEPK